MWFLLKGFYYLLLKLISRGQVSSSYSILILDLIHQSFQTIITSFYFVFMFKVELFQFLISFFDLFLVNK